uniref:LRRGT00064 n=1 Tax=Rattus norvegicus TaxID=10116 RepID=Q6TUI0_RAT|nr:LRRGT00064 [Rattus norvegicus]
MSVNCRTLRLVKRAGLHLSKGSPASQKGSSVQPANKHFNRIQGLRAAELPHLQSQSPSLIALRTLRGDLTQQLLQWSRSMPKNREGFYRHLFRAHFN